MEVAVGAISPLLRKLGELLKDEYSLEKRVKKGVRFLERELEMMQASLRRVAEVPPDKIDEQVKSWAGMVRELSYDMENTVDAFMVHVEEGSEHEPANANMKNRVKKFLKKTTRLFSKGKALHQIAAAIKEAQDRAKQLAELRQRWCDLEIPDTSAGAAIDPRLIYLDVEHLVGIDQTRDELIKMLIEGDEGSNKQLKTVSIVGFGGLGKTTLARAAYEKIKMQFDCGALVSVSRIPDITKIFKKMLYELNKGEYANINESVRDEAQLINELRGFLQNKRYLIIIDDIWDEQAWRFIKGSFPQNSLGSRLIMTTRKISVAEACCSSSDDITYKMKPLSNDDSQRLFYKRIFGSGNECPPELKQVSREILKKCGGVPLAIITVSCILANNKQITKDRWYTLLKSIGRGLTEGHDVEEMQMILSYSYYDLPSHLKNCLLYLSVFPEDYEIGRDRLIWRWIAEGFVHAENKKTSLFEIGESYFNELINRSMIQPVDIDAEGRANACQVHDMMLDLICNLSSKANFVTILDDIEQRSSSQSKVHSLSLQNGMVEPTTPQASRCMLEARSFTVFGPAENQMPSLSSFLVLRVLDLEGCYIGEGFHKINLSYVGNLFHLRYLGLGGTYVRELPMEIGRLHFLQTLDCRVHFSRLRELPSSVVRLRHLMCLHIEHNTRVPNGMRNLTSLEVLTGLNVGGSPNIVKELVHLTQLRVLGIRWDGLDESLYEALVESLSNLHKIHVLMIHGGSGCIDLMGDGWVPPPNLRTFEISARFCSFKTLPTWINSSSLPLISRLQIWVKEVRPEDIRILGMLPVLRSLSLGLERDEEQVESSSRRFVVSADAFPCARECKFIGFVTVPSMFPQGAAPRLEYLKFCFRARDIGSGDLDGLCMGSLPSLQRLEVTIWCTRASDGKVNEAVAALRHAADVHANSPTLNISVADGGAPSGLLSAEEAISWMSAQRRAEKQHGCGRGDRGEGIASWPSPLDKFDDPNNVLCPGLEAELSESCADCFRLEQSSNKRCSDASEMSCPRYLNIEGSGLSEAMPKEIVVDNSTEELDLEEGKMEIKTNYMARECEKMKQNVAKSSQVLPNMDVPAELRCFLCKAIFDDAVMIPCCQHSFCNKCIVSALAEMKKCPKCSSTRCTINDLLPNLSLRKAIKHFLETQPAGVVGVDDTGPMYAPDVESGIEAKEASCAMSIHQQEQKLLCSPSATGKDSNHIMPNPTKEIKRSSSIKIRLDGNKPTETASALNRDGPKEASRNADFQGSASSSKVYQNIALENDDLPTIEAKALRNSLDGSGFAAPATRARKGGRTCYMCGSPNHLIRDCPVASNVHSEDSAFHGDAYGPPNWQGSMFHPLRPYGNIYGAPGIIPFDPGVVPVSPFGVPSYMPPFYGGMNNPYAFVGMGGMPSPVLPGVQQPLSHTGFMGIHDNANSHKAPSGRGLREYGYHSSSEDYHDEDGRGISHKQYKAEKRSERYYDEGSTRVQKRHRKDAFGSPTREKPCYSSDEELVDQKYPREFDSHGRERRNRFSEQCAAELHGMSDNSMQDTRQRSKQHYRSASGKTDESSAKCKSVYSEKTHRQSRKERSPRERADDVHKSSKNTYRHKYRDHKIDHSTDYKRESKVKVSIQSSRHANTKVRWPPGK